MLGSRTAGFRTKQSPRPRDCRQCLRRETWNQRADSNRRPRGSVRAGKGIAARSRGKSPLPPRKLSSFSFRRGRSRALPETANFGNESSVVSLANNPDAPGARCPPFAF